MTAKELQKVMAPITPLLPAYTLIKRTFFAPINEGILRGVLFESSSYTKTRFYINVFSLPLCYPEKHLYLNFGFRLKRNGSDLWDTTDPSTWKDFERLLHSHVVPYLEQLYSAAAFAEEATRFPLENPHTLKAAAFAYARGCQWETSVKHLDLLFERLDLAVPWQREIKEKAELLRKMILESPVRAQEQLLQWEQESVENMGLLKLPRH